MAGAGSGVSAHSDHLERARHGRLHGAELATEGLAVLNQEVRGVAVRALSALRLADLGIDELTIAVMPVAHVGRVPALEVRLAVLMRSLRRQAEGRAIEWHFFRLVPEALEALTLFEFIADAGRHSLDGLRQRGEAQDEFEGLLGLDGSGPRRREVTQARAHLASRLAEHAPLDLGAEHLARDAGEGLDARAVVR